MFSVYNKLLMSSAIFYWWCMCCCPIIFKGLYAKLAEHLRVISWQII